MKFLESRTLMIESDSKEKLQVEVDKYKNMQTVSYIGEIHEYEHLKTFVVNIFFKTYTYDVTTNV